MDAYQKQKEEDLKKVELSNLAEGFIKHPFFKVLEADFNEDIQKLTDRITHKSKIKNWEEYNEARQELNALKDWRRKIDHYRSGGKRAYKRLEEENNNG